LRHDHRRLDRGDWLRTVPGAVLLAGHYVTWFIGVRMTDATSSTLIINLNPVVMPFLVWLVLRERVTAGEAAGSLIAVAGVVVLAVGQRAASSAASNPQFSETSLAGVGVCVISMTLCVAYLVAGRRLNRGRSLWSYIVPLYLVSGLICAAAAIAVREPLPPFSWREVFVVLGAALVPTVIGHTAANWCMMHLRSQVVATANLGQFLIVGALAYPVLGELPPPAVLPAGFLVVSGALVVIRSATPKVRREIAVAATEPAG
jgi:drug/metabolite transporter (DMT)-like permease